MNWINSWALICLSKSMRCDQFVGEFYWEACSANLGIAVCQSAGRSESAISLLILISQFRLVKTKISLSGRLIIAPVKFIQKLEVLKAMRLLSFGFVCSVWSSELEIALENQAWRRIIEEASVYQLVLQSVWCERIICSWERFRFWASSLQFGEVLVHLGEPIRKAAKRIVDDKRALN